MFYTEEINKIVLSLNDNKAIQLIDFIETYAYEMRKDLVCKKEEIRCTNNDLTKEDIKEHNSNWPEISDHSYRIFIVRGSEILKNKCIA